MDKKVVVTTVHRGVFFGTIVEENGDTVVLENARNCLFWHKSTRGFLGLAKKGPQEGSTIGPFVDRLKLFGVTSISDCSKDAITAWEQDWWT